MNSKLFLSALAFTAITTTAVYAQPKNKLSSCDVENNSRKLWEDHIMWTRNVIFNIIDGLPGTNEAVARLLQNQTDIGNFFGTYYGQATGNAITSLLNTHITTAADLLTALKNNDAAAIAAASDAWYKNAKEIAAAMASINPNYDPKELDAMMKTHLDLTAQEAVARLNHDYPGDVAAYEAVHLEILAMSDMFVSGLIRQFPNRFNNSPNTHAQMAKEIDLSDDAITLGQNTPNPFDQKTTIALHIPESVANAQLVFYDLNGRLIKTVEIKDRGDSELTVNAANLDKGAYIYGIVADGTLIGQKRMVR